MFPKMYFGIQFVNNIPFARKVVYYATFPIGALFIKVVSLWVNTWKWQAKW